MFVQKASHFALFMTKENGIKMGRLTAGKRLRSGREILPPQKKRPGERTSAGTCGEDGRQFCVEPWPSRLLGPVPTAPPDLRALDEVVIEDPDADVGQCGNRCTGQYDCNEGDHADGSCDCTVLDPVGAKLYGVDPVVPPSLCMLIVKGNGAVRLSGRGLEGDRVCQCNGTYASSRCCGSKDGMI